MSLPLAHWPVLDFENSRLQELVFCLLNLVVIVCLLGANELLSTVWGPVTPFLFSFMCAGFLGHLVLLRWLLVRQNWSDKALANFTSVSILINIILTLAASTTNRDDSQYYILMAVPVLQAAFRYSFLSTLAVVLVADFLNFFWLYQYIHLHSGTVEVDEYVEASTISFVYTLTGLVVWLLVNHLRRKELYLADSLEQLTRTRSHLLEEEKLAVVGRLSAAIAGQIRSPLVLMSTSLGLLRNGNLTPSERQSLLNSILQESARLEALVSDFVSYSQPSHIDRTPSNLAASLRSVAAAARDSAASRNIKLSVTAPNDLSLLVDEPKTRTALSHILSHAVDHSPASDSIHLRAEVRPGGGARFLIDHAGPYLSSADLSRLFDPFFHSGSYHSGLGLAVARNIFRAHGGEVSVIAAPDSRFCFSAELPAVPVSALDPAPVEL
ncbi:MAG TPA: HAMP domain-containing sensor histidine kinase [Dongiaceae bacterium]|nr:HAMP domain-containing sensor histidine kinase [Dongiaceae bacterium]